MQLPGYETARNPDGSLRRGARLGQTPDEALLSQIANSQIEAQPVIDARNRLQQDFLRRNERLGGIQSAQDSAAFNALARQGGARSGALERLAQMGQIDRLLQNQRISGDRARGILGINQAADEFSTGLIPQAARLESANQIANIEAKRKDIDELNKRRSVDYEELSQQKSARDLFNKQLEISNQSLL